MTRAFAVTAVAWLIGGFAPAAAQVSRGDFIEQARSEFNLDRRIELLTQAMDPRLGAPDSLAAVAAFDLAQTLIGGGDRTGAIVWLRWAARHAGNWPIDSLYYSPGLLDEYERAVSAVQAGVGAQAAPVVTSWRWPVRLNPAAGGHIEIVAADSQVRLTATIEGRATVQAGEAVSLPAGSYEIVASAEGFESMRVAREVLPDVATVLEFDLPALVPDEEEVQVLSQSRRGGPPWRLIGAGAAAVGVAALLLLGGDSTGGITITFPQGNP